MNGRRLSNVPSVEPSSTTITSRCGCGQVCRASASRHFSSTDILLHVGITTVTIGRACCWDVIKGWILSAFEGNGSVETSQMPHAILDKRNHADAVVFGRAILSKSVDGDACSRPTGELVCDRSAAFYHYLRRFNLCQTSGVA